MNDDYLEPFESPRLLLDQARRKIEDFAEQRLLFTGDHEFIEELDYKSREKVVCMRLKRKIPGEIRLIAYGILNDLRHALDQAVGDAALLTGRQDTKGVYFPIGKSPADLENEIKRRCKGVHPDLIRFLKALNVCETGHPLLYATLALAGPNKHQRIIGVRPDEMFAVEDLGSRGRVYSAPRWVPAKNHLELIRIGDGTNYEFKLHVILGICLGDGKPPLDRTAEALLGEAAGEIERIIGGLEAEAARIRGGQYA